MSTTFYGINENTKEKTLLIGKIALKKGKIIEIVVIGDLVYPRFDLI